MKLKKPNHVKNKVDDLEALHLAVLREVNHLQFSSPFEDYKYARQEINKAFRKYRKNETRILR